MASVIDAFSTHNKTPRAMELGQDQLAKISLITWAFSLLCFLFTIFDQQLPKLHLDFWAFL